MAYKIWNYRKQYVEEYGPFAIAITLTMAFLYTPLDYNPYYDIVTAIACTFILFLCCVGNRLAKRDLERHTDFWAKFQRTTSSEKLEALRRDSILSIPVSGVAILYMGIFAFYDVTWGYGFSQAMSFFQVCEGILQISYLSWTYGRCLQVLGTPVKRLPA